MKALKIVGAGVAATLTLLALNMTLFPVIFPEGPPTLYANAREQPLAGLHLAAFLVEGLVLAAVYAAFWRRDRRGVVGGAIYGGVVALFAVAGHNLHMYAEVDTAPAEVLAPTVWVVGTWAVAGAVIGLILDGRRPGGADVAERATPPGADREEDADRRADGPQGWYPGAAGRD